MQDAGMQVETSPIKVNGRVLQTPTLFFNNQQVRFTISLAPLTEMTLLPFRH
jgi:hypothetical protein